MSIVAKQLHGSRCQKGGGAPLPSLRPMTCGQMAGWIKMALGMEVGLGPGQIVLDRDQLRSPKKGQSPPIFGSFLLWPNGWMHQAVTWYGGRPRPRRLCVTWGPRSPSQKRGQSSQFSAYVYCGQTAVCSRIPRGTEVGLSLGDIVSDEDPAPLPKKGAEPFPPNFRPIFIVAKRLDASSCHLVWR